MFKENSVSKGASRMEQERYLSPAEVETITGRKVQTWANERHEGRGLPYYKVGRSIRYKLSEVLEFMERHRVDPARQGDEVEA
jgi:hypothetical protein